MKDALGLLFIIGMIALSVWFYAGDAIAAKTGLPISRSNIADSVTSFDDTTIEVANQPDPSQRHLDLKQHMLELTNQERMNNGVPPVRMGNNPAAQLHAEAALEGCYSVHWDRWGLKPNQRYTITGGTGSDGENVSGLSYCIKAQDNYKANSPMAKEIAETIQGWMESPGHRRNLLDPAHTILNVGIAYDKYNAVMVQQFSSDYVHYQIRPFIDSAGVLRLEATSDRANFDIGNTVNIQIYYDPPPRKLSRGQLAHTYALCNGKYAGRIVEPLTGGRFYTDPTVTIDTQEQSCVDPYQTDPNLPAPSNPDEAHQAWADAKTLSATTTRITTKEIRIIANRLEKSANHINVEADINQILQENGPGIYTVLLWGRPIHMSESTPLSKQAIFRQTTIPAGNPYIHFRQEFIQHPEEQPTPLPRTEMPTPALQVVVGTQPPTAATPAPVAPTTAQFIPLATAAPTPITALQVPSHPTVKLPTPIPAQPARLIPNTPVYTVPTPGPTIAPQPGPTATQVPTPTLRPQPYETYTDPNTGHSIQYPYGWEVQKGQDKTIFRGDNPVRGVMTVETYPILKSQSIGDLADEYMATLLAKAPDWVHFNPQWAGGGTNTSGQYLTLKFSRQQNQASCREDGEAHIFRSKFAPKKLMGYAVAMSVCEASAGQLPQSKETFLNSFRED